MASDAKQTSRIRRRKRAMQGRKRKAKNLNQGTTQSKAALFGDEE